MCHFSAICVSMVPGVPRRGPRFQFRILMRVCSRSWLGLQAASTDTFQAFFLFGQVISRVVGEGVPMGAVACHKELRSVSRQRDPVNTMGAKMITKIIRKQF